MEGVVFFSFFNLKVLRSNLVQNTCLDLKLLFLVGIFLMAMLLHFCCCIIIKWDMIQMPTFGDPSFVYATITSISCPFQKYHQIFRWTNYVELWPGSRVLVVFLHTTMCVFVRAGINKDNISFKENWLQVISLWHFKNYSEFVMTWYKKNQIDKLEYF